MLTYYHYYANSNKVNRIYFIHYKIFSMPLFYTVFIICLIILLIIKLNNFSLLELKDEKTAELYIDIIGKFIFSVNLILECY